jgi:methyl-accepting chemotaxis protein
METLLVVAIIATAVAIIVQAGVLLAIYLMSRKVAGRVDGLIGQSQRLAAPLETVTHNLKAASTDLVEMGKIGREQLSHIEQMVADTREALNRLLADARQQITAGIDQINSTAMRPVREWSAIATGVTEGVRVFFRRPAHERAAREDTAA